MPQISGQQTKMLVEALLDAFPSTARLDDMLLYQLDVNRQRIAFGDDLDEIGRKVISKFNHNYQIPSLIQAAWTANPHNPLLAFAQQDLAGHGALVVQQTKQAVQAPIRADNPHFAPFHRPQYNRGIPFTAIMRLRAEQNKIHLLQS